MKENPENLWLEWRVEINPEESNSLLSSDFRISNQKNRQKNYAAVPLILIISLNEKYKLLNILRSSTHKAKYPKELVKIIRKINRYSKTS